MFFDLTNMNNIGKMKDDSEGKTNIEFVEFKSKMYSLIDVNGKENKKGKGVNSAVVGNIRHKEYHVLFGKKIIRHNVKGFQSKLHKTEKIKPVL